MQCLACNATVPEGSKFCQQCAKALPRACSFCGHANLAEARFCSQCGTSLNRDRPQVPSASSQTSIRPGTAAERRQLTIMFCDMVGSSALSTRLDPEEQRNVIPAFHTCCANEVKSFGGMVAQYLGDGVLAYFRYPTAHENDAGNPVWPRNTLGRHSPQTRSRRGRADSHSHRLWRGCRWRSRSRGCYAGERRDRGDYESVRAPASDRRAQFPRHFSSHTPVGRCAL